MSSCVYVELKALCAGYSLMPTPIPLTEEERGLNVLRHLLLAHVLLANAGRATLLTSYPY